MIRSISFQDVLSLVPFQGMSQSDLLSRKMDSEVAPYLYKMGINIDTQFLVQACLHRNLAGEKVLGYRYCGMERTDKEWIDSKFGSMGARINSQKDKELSSDMIRMSRQGFNYEQFKKMALMAATPEELRQARERREPLIPVETYEDDLATMKSLQVFQIAARGPLHPEEDMINPPQGVL